MQNINKYLHPLKPDLHHQKNPTAAAIEGTHQFIQGIQDLPLEKSGVGYKPYYMPYGKAFTGMEYYNILNNISKLLKVRIMWRWLLRRDDGMAIKGIWIIGNSDRINIAHGYMNWFFNTYWDYHRNICINAQEEAKRASYSSVRSYASKLVAIYMHDIYYAIYNKLEEDIFYGMWLDNMVKEMFRLAYKNYKGKPEYYHAISTHWYHRRMIS